MEYRALVQETDTLSQGFRSGIRSLCKGFYSKELLATCLHNLSASDTTSDNMLVEKVLSALQDRVKNDRSAFQKVLQVLHGTMSMGYMAERLEKKLATLEQEHARQLAQDFDTRNMSSS